MSASTIQFVSTNVANSFEQIGVSARDLKRSDSIAGTVAENLSVDLLESR
jgi:hypothetical protein